MKENGLFYLLDMFYQQQKFGSTTGSLFIVSWFRWWMNERGRGYLNRTRILTVAKWNIFQRVNYFRLYLFQRLYVNEFIFGFVSCNEESFLHYQYLQSR